MTRAFMIRSQKRMGSSKTKERMELHRTVSCYDTVVLTGQDMRTRESTANGTGDLMFYLTEGTILS